MPIPTLSSVLCQKRSLGPQSTFTTFSPWHDTLLKTNTASIVPLSDINQNGILGTVTILQRCSITHLPPHSFYAQEASPLHYNCVPHITLPLEIGATIHGALEIGATIHGALEIGATIHRALEIGATIHGALEIGATIHRVLEIGATIDRALEIGATIHGALEIGATIHRALEIGATIHGAL